MAADRRTAHREPTRRHGGRRVDRPGSDRKDKPNGGEAGAGNRRVPDDLVKAFDAAWERGLERRIDYSFIKTYKPVMDDSPFRAWNTTAEYREWCDRNLPRWLGYGAD